jgi:hypothetical protein
MLLATMGKIEATNGSPEFLEETGIEQKRILEKHLFQRSHPGYPPARTDSHIFFV